VRGELLVLAVLGNAAEEAIAEAGPENFSGKIVIDAMSPLDFSAGFPPRPAITGEDSLGERVHRALPDTKVVKAFNTIGNPYFVDPSFSDGQPTMLIAGEDDGAKRTVVDVLNDFGWSDVVDMGGIDSSRELEAICIAWVKIGGARGAWDHGLSCSPASHFPIISPRPTRYSDGSTADAISQRRRRSRERIRTRPGLRPSPKRGGSATWFPPGK
jgi:predicted dinucleotide-binding enzyme